MNKNTVSESKTANTYYILILDESGDVIDRYVENASSGMDIIKSAAQRQADMHDGSYEITVRS